MAAPQTHFVVAFGLQVAVAALLKKTFSFGELAIIYFFGFGLDFVDHFTSPSYVKDIFQVRLKRFFKGGDVGVPSENVKIPVCWLHLWPGLLLAIISGFVFFGKYYYIPFMFWCWHLGIDNFQKNDGNYPYYPVLYPFSPKKVGDQAKRRGYPVKSRIEVIVSTILALFIILFEVIRALMGFTL